MSAPRGHRIVPHTADLIIEAWAPSRNECYEEAVLALVESFADRPDVPATEPIEFELDPADDEELLVSLLEEAVYVIDVVGVPVSVMVEETEDGALAGTFDVARFEQITQTGPMPKAVTRHELAFRLDGDVWRARATIDV